jgi:hypothetical protein
VDGGLPDVELLRQDVMMCDTRSELQFTIVDVTCWVVKRDQPFLDGSREGASPKKRLNRAILLGYKLDATHSHGRGILGAQSVRLGLGDDLGDPLGPSSEVFR